LENQFFAWLANKQIDAYLRVTIQPLISDVVMP